MISQPLGLELNNISKNSISEAISQLLIYSSTLAVVTSLTAPIEHLSVGLMRDMSDEG